MIWDSTEHRTRKHENTSSKEKGNMVNIMKSKNQILYSSQHYRKTIKPLASMVELGKSVFRQLFLFLTDRIRFSNVHYYQTDRLFVRIV